LFQLTFSEHITVPTQSYILNCHLNKFTTWLIASRDIVVCIATRYELGGPGIESRWRRDFPHSSIPALGATSFLYNGCWVFLGSKAAEVWR